MHHYLTAPMLTTTNQTWGVKSRVRIAKQPAPDGAVIFLHGFRGGALKTWFEFPYMLSREPKSASYDFYFYGYDTREQAGGSAVAFREFLTAVAEDPATSIVNPSLVPGIPARDSRFRYKKIVVAAHSLGAVVARLALVQCLSLGGQPLSWLSTVRMVLFAPAHCGAPAVKLASLLLRGAPGAGALEALARRLYRSINDLDPNGGTLPRLERATLNLLQSGPADLVACHRAQVVHGEHEWVVNVLPFLQDLPMKRFKDADHFEVCKPDFSDRRPLDFLLQAM